MVKATPDYRLRYEGYRATPPLWEQSESFPYPQISLGSESVHPLRTEPQTKQRLGKLVETFVYHDLQRLPGISWIADSLQIQENHRTVGEIDALYYDNGVPVHLEVAYKFYLFDTLTRHPDPLAQWIGPNRRDDLSRKLQKLRHRQFPLLSHPAAAPYLAEHGLRAHEIEQRICFRAQLFVPYHRQDLIIRPLNPDGAVGFHLPFRAMAALAEYHFFIPDKLDWLIAPHPKVAWLGYTDTESILTALIDQGRSPLLWWRSTSGELGRCFLTSW